MSYKCRFCKRKVKTSPRPEHECCRECCYIFGFIIQGTREYYDEQFKKYIPKPKRTKFKCSAKVRKRMRLYMRTHGKNKSKICQRVNIAIPNCTGLIIRKEIVPKIMMVQYTRAGIPRYQKARYKREN